VEVNVTRNVKEDLKRRAEASFKKVEWARADAKTMLQYEAEGRAVAEKTERLKALRLAKEAAEGA
jgi:hypothetical protein